MMNQLGIKSLRPGPAGNESAQDHANYDVTKANPYPELPDVLTLKNGRKVTTPEQWWNQRRPEIVEDMEREVYGHGVPHADLTILKPIPLLTQSMWALKEFPAMEFQKREMQTGSTTREVIWPLSQQDQSSDFLERRTLVFQMII